MRIYHPTVVMQGCRVEIQDGAPGVLQTVGYMRELVKMGRVNVSVRQAAELITLNFPQKDRLGEINGLFCYVRDRIRYVGDILDEETLKPAEFTLLTKCGDCDDKAVLLASLLESIGIPTRFVVTGYSTPDEFEHVYLMAMMHYGTFIEMDPTEPNAVGWSAPMPVVRYVEGGF